MPIATKITYGLCKLKGCRLRFRKKNKRQMFCCKEHKDSFHRRGQFPFDHMQDDIMKRVASELAAEVAPLRARLAELERLVTESRAESSLYLLGAAQVERALYLLGAAQVERDRVARVLNAGGGAAA